MSLAVVDLSGLDETDEGKEESKDAAVDAEDTLWPELLAVLERLAKGVEGDVSALNRAVRSLNRFRGRMTDYTYGRLFYFVIPAEERPALIEALRTTTRHGWEHVRAQVVSQMTAIPLEAAKKQLLESADSVVDAVVAAVRKKEELAVEQLVKERREADERKAQELAEARLKQERLLKGSALMSASAFKLQRDVSAFDELEKQKSVTHTPEGSVDLEMKSATTETAAVDQMNDYNITVSFLKEGSTKVAPAADESMAGDSKATDTETKTTAPKKVRKFYPETKVFLQLLIAYRFFDSDNYGDALKLVEMVLHYCHEANRRTLDLMCARALALFSLCHQRENGDDSWLRIRSRLFEEYKRAQLEQNEAAQCVAINLILHHLVVRECGSGLYAMAAKFAKNAGFPKTAVGAMLARNHYYVGRIAAVQLDYGRALHHLQHALRRAPQNGALGFKLACVKWLATVHLLMGDIPEHSLLSTHAALCERAKRELNPYICVTDAVRNGELRAFNETLASYEAIFRKDGLGAVLLRLKQNVIKTGLRKISKAYSSISLADISVKLDLASAKDAYFIVAKAIRDGVIPNCVIDFAKGVLTTKETPDVYKCREPYAHFAKRVSFCLDIHTTAVKALRYPHKDEEHKALEEDEMDVEEIVEAIREALEDDGDE